MLKTAKMIQSQFGNLLRYSSVVESNSWGFEAETTFYNQVLLVETEFNPQQVLVKILDIEKTLGRVRSGTTYSSRIIDIDILFYGDEQINLGNLVIPHPLLHKRNFVLIPLASIAPELVHPVFGKTITELQYLSDDSSNVSVVVDAEQFADLLRNTN